MNTTYCLANNLERAEVFVSQLSASILEIVESGEPLEKKHENLRYLFEEHANIKTISRAALGAKWRSLDKNLRLKFSEVFKTYLIIKYGKQFGDFNGAKMILERSIDAGKRGILVNTRFIMPGTLPISVVADMG